MSQKICLAKGVWTFFLRQIMEHNSMCGKEQCKENVRKSAIYDKIRKNNRADETKLPAKQENWVFANSNSTDRGRTQETGCWRWGDVIEPYEPDIAVMKRGMGLLNGKGFSTPPRPPKDPCSKIRANGLCFNRPPPATRERFDTTSYSPGQVLDDLHASAQHRAIQH